MPEYQKRFYSKILELRDLVVAEIETDDECLNRLTAEEDSIDNAPHYRELLFQWQKRILEWEQAWDCTDPNAAVELAAISDVHAMFFGQVGLTAYLDNIKFEFTEQDQAEMRQRLDEIKEGE